MRQFSQGLVYALPQGANPTPVPFALIKGATPEIKQAKVPLRGPYKFPIDFGDGDGDLSLKVQAADFRASCIAMVSGGSTVTGSRLLSPGETFTIPGSPFQVTVAQSATFIENAGVWDVTAQKWLDVVAAGPATGQVSYAAGVYTFAAADVGHIVVIYYVYSSASVGKTTTVTNVLQGPSTFYLVRIYNIYTLAGVVKPTGWEFPQVHFPSLSMALKTGDWTEVNLEGVCSADVGQTLFKTYFGD